MHQGTRKSFLCLLAAVAGCVQNAKTDMKTLIIGIESEIKNLDVRSSTDANSIHVANLFSQHLVKTNMQLLPEGDLAESFEVKDGRIYTFKLPAGATWHDGRPLTSDDVLASFRQAAGPTSRAMSSFKDVESFEAPDPLTFIIKLKNPNASFLLGSIADIYIHPKHYIDDPKYPSHPIGSGPYKFVKRSDRDIIFERFDQVKRFNGGKLQAPSFFDKVVVRSIQDPTTRFLSLMGGDIDLLINALSAKRLSEVSQNPFLQVHRAPGTSYQYLGFNQRNEKFRDPRVRRALAMAINRDEIIKHKYLGYAQPAAGMLSPSNFFADPALTQVPYDPAGAKQLLKEAGKENLEFELKSSTDRDIGSMLLVLREYWEKIGVKVTIRPYEFATFFADIQKGNFECYCLKWTAVSDPDLMNKVYHSNETPPGKNRIHYRNLEVDRLLDRAQAEMDLNKRRELYFKVQQKISQEMPYISLWYPDNTAVATKILKNFKLHPTGNWETFMEAHKENE